MDDDPGPCSVPRGGGWRPGARWARDGTPARELGRRTEAVGHPFRAMRPDEGGHGGATPTAKVPSPALPPLVLAAMVGQREVVTAACPSALALGLTPDMAVTHARALVPALDVRPADFAADLALLEQFAVHAVRHWTPTAAPSHPDGLWMDLTGTTHLFGGEERFCRKLLAFFRRLGFAARVAIADTPGAAHAIARFGGSDIAIVAPGATAAALAPLPVDALRMEPAAVAACRRFGFERVADLMPMPRGPLARRLGLGAIERLDQALGRVSEPIVPTLVAEAPVVERRLLEPIGTPEAIGQVIEDLVGDLIPLLRERGLGVRALALRLDRVDGGEQQIMIGAARATRDAAHLVRLLRLRMEKIDPGLGIERGRLVALRTEPLGATAVAGLLTDASAAADIAPLVDQIVGRVGERAVFRTSLVESDVPERAVRRVSPLAGAAGWPSWRRPARLLSRPEPLSNVMALLPDHPPRRFTWRGEVHEVVAGDGPERIYGEWWVRDGELSAVRDYYQVEDRSGGRFWVFRRGDAIDAQTGDRTWWIHGAFG